MNDVSKRIESLYKDKSGQLISLVLFRFPDLPMESAEDIVQEAFADAAAGWPGHGMPDNPAGWLYQSCKNKSINLLKKNKTEGLSLVTQVPVAPDEIAEQEFTDAQLLMLIACCHPHLTPKTQVVVALKYVANLKTENIAMQLGVSLDAVEKMLYRARQKIKDETLTLSAQGGSLPAERLSIVHKVIYLIFNEGYRCEGHAINQGRILCEEALTLNKNLLDSPRCNAETRALQALMLFNAARFDTRFDAQGDIIELEYQDRSRWSTAYIGLGYRLLVASEDTTFSPYHLEASIAYMHCSATTFKDTPWETICKYYKALLEIYPSPFAEINYAVSLQYKGQSDEAFSILMNLYKNPYFNKSYILNLSLAKYFDRTGQEQEAKSFFERARTIKADDSKQIT